MSNIERRINCGLTSSEQGCITEIVRTFPPKIGNFVVNPGLGGYSTIQDAVDAASSSGTTNKVVYITAGVYNENVTITTDNVVLVGISPQGLNDSVGDVQGTVINGIVSITSNNCELNSLAITTTGSLVWTGSVLLRLQHVTISGLVDLTGMTVLGTLTVLNSRLRAMNFGNFGVINASYSQFFGTSTTGSLSNSTHQFISCTFFGTFDFAGVDTTIFLQFYNCYIAPISNNPIVQISTATAPNSSFFVINTIIVPPSVNWATSANGGTLRTLGSSFTVTAPTAGTVPRVGTIGTFTAVTQFVSV